ncbi:MAG: B12-binding domain-containing radical SAM protein [Firmicutes bacterium]|nr:B12-binding domain-containing radical SAM protein [Bacillota bacterium]
MLIEAQKHKMAATAIYPPLGIACLEAYIEKYADFPVEIKTISTDNPEAAIQAISGTQNGQNAGSSGFEPDIIGISAVTEGFTRAGEIAVLLKSKYGNIPVLLGGCHISAIPESLPEAFDAAVIGEGEITFLRIISVLYQKGSLTGEDYLSIPGMMVRINGNPVFSPFRPPIEDLDTIPYPRRSIPRLGITHMVTSRGCPFSCIYCATFALWGKVRAHSPEYVTNEIKYLYENLGIRQIILFDDNFTASPKRVKIIADNLEKENLNGKISYLCYGRTRAVSRELVSDLARLGVDEIYLGADSVQDSRIEGGRLDKASLAKNQTSVDICHNAGMRVNCSFVIGLPGQTKEDLDDIYNFIDNNRSKLTGIQVSPINLFPGTPLWEYAVNKGKLPKQIKDWSVLENFTHISGFTPENYIYLNENMSIETFTDYCRKFDNLVTGVIT